jgi:hypothetical protein
MKHLKTMIEFERKDKMKKIIFIFALTCMPLLSSFLFADNGSVRGDNYWSVELGQATFGEDATFPGSEELDDIYSNFAFGYRINNYLSAEANMYWWQINHKTEPDPIEVNGVEVGEVNFESGVGVSLRGDFPIYKKLSGFALVSFNMLNFDFPGQKPDGHDSGVGYSGGLEFDFKNGAVFTRYSVLLDNENDDDDDFQVEDFTSVGLGYRWNLPF